MCDVRMEYVDVGAGQTAIERQVRVREVHNVHLGRPTLRL